MNISQTRKLELMTLLLLAVVPWLVFQRALDCQFSGYDDPLNIIDNTHVSSLSASNLKWMFTDVERARRYLPFGWMSYAVDRQLFGLTPISYHTGNLLLHVLNTLLVYVLLRRLMELAVGPEVFRNRPIAAILAPACAAILWALNPLRVEPVAWCSARIYLVASMLFISSVLAYLRAARQEMAGRSGTVWRGLALAGYTASLLTYPVAIFGVCVFPLLETYPLRRAPLDAPWKLPRWIVIRLLPMLAIAATAFAFMLWCNFTTPEKIPAPEQNSGTLLHKFMQAFFVWAYYVWKPSLPFNLAPQYPTFFSFNPLSLPFLTAFVVVCALTAWIWRQRGRRPTLWLGWFIHLIMLTPLLGLTEVRYHSADRYDYLVGIVPFALLSGIVWKWWQSRPRLILGGAIAIGIAWACLTAQQLLVWHNPISLFQQIARRAGDSPMRPYVDALLGGAYRDAGSNAMAIATCQAALAARPGLPLALQVLGDVYHSENELSKALRCYDDALREGPGLVDVRVNRGVVLGKLGKLDEAREAFSEILKTTPDCASARQNLAYVLQLQSQAAIAH